MAVKLRKMDRPRRLGIGGGRTIDFDEEGYATVEDEALARRVAKEHMSVVVVKDQSSAGKKRPKHDVPKAGESK